MLGPVLLGLLLGQAGQTAPLRLAAPTVLSDAPPVGTRLGGTFVPPLEPGTRLLPFGESEPSRGPIGPPPPPGPPPLSAQEWRAVLLARAKREAPDSSGFRAGPKDPWRAVALSAEGFFAGLLFPPLLSVGPSAGQAYAGQWTQAAVTSSIRTVALSVMFGQVASFASTLETSGTTTSQLSSAATTLDIVMIAGGIVIALAAGFDLATAYGEAQRANEKWERSVVGDSF